MTDAIGEPVGLQTIRLSAWLPPIAFVGLLVAGFATRNSDLPGSALSYATLMALLCALVWIVPMRETPPLPRRSGLWLVIGFALALLAAISILPVQSALTGVAGGLGGALDPSAFWIELIKLLGVFCAFAAAYRIAMNDEAARRLLDVLLVAGAAWALFAIGMHIADPGGIYGMKKIGAGRLTGALSSPNSAATLFGSLSVLAFARLLGRLSTPSSRSVLERISPLYATALLLSFAALTLTLSRTGITATVVMMGVTAIVLLWKRLSIVGTVAVLLGGAGLVAVLFATPLTAALDRALNLERDAEVRHTINMAHLEIAERAPLLGQGLGSFNTINNAIPTESNYPDLSIIRTGHNVFIQWYEETGLIGLGLIVGANLVIAGTLVMAARRRQRMGERLWAIGLAYGVFILHGVTDYALQEPALALYAAGLLGLGFAIARNSSAA